MVGASGGPKWFVLYGLDRYLFGEFFARRPDTLITLGSSAGAWRLCCLATADPVAAIDRLATLYSEQRYSDDPSVREVTEQARIMLKAVLGTTGAAEIVNNRRIATHIACDRGRGPASSENAFLQAATLGLSAACNAFSRASLSWFYQRTLFSSMGEVTPYRDLEDIATTVVPLTEKNLFDAMIASGSIPFVLEGVRDIIGAPRGLYWDGGICDYHFDLPFHDGDELVLYPHFYGAVTPGWFDKHVPWRRARAANFDNVVLLAPTPDFIATLPGGKLADRKDFRRFAYEERVAVFRRVLERSQVLAEEFAELVAGGVPAERIQPIGNLRPASRPGKYKGEV